MRVGLFSIILHNAVASIDGQVRSVRPYVEQKNAYFRVFWRFLVVHRLFSTRFFDGGGRTFPSMVASESMRHAFYTDSPPFFGRTRFSKRSIRRIEQETHMGWSNRIYVVNVTHHSYHVTFYSYFPRTTSYPRLAFY
jgi:hypothetical protein